MKKTLSVLAILLLFLVLTTGVNAVQAQQEETLETVYDVIKADDRLVSFGMLVDAAALADNLAQDGPFTVFAPTEAAWATFETMKNNTDATLTEILLYHVINGNYTAPNVANLATLPTLLGEHIAFSVQNGTIVLNDSIKVTVTDMPASNGVVHIIDTVLLPPINSLITSPLGSSDMSITEVLANQGNFTTFLDLVDQAGLMSMLADTNTVYTVFAPTDEAFASTSSAMLTQWMANPDELKTILLYHIVGDKLSINQLANDDFIPTLEGRPLILSIDENIQVFINGYPIEQFNIQAQNGVIHSLNQVLTP
ncbi:MAG: fasciclin domain-containing protein [Chloroflexi bacterium]|nr:fasciclin domain-containing protein [Chloroflexota bacterium]MBP8055746.1 fasciclin domain-containing protein [Chloroflexota bacterium]